MQKMQAEGSAGDGRSRQGTGRVFRQTLSVSCRLLPPLAVLFVACSGSSGPTPLVIYSPHGRDQLTLTEKSFEAANPDIDLHWLDMGSQDAFDRVRSERANPQGDVWFGGPSTLFLRAAKDSLLDVFKPTWRDALAERGRDPEGYWHAVYETPAVIMYNTDAIKAADAPKDWDDVLLPKWKNKILIREPFGSGTMRVIWGMLIQRGMKSPGDTAPGFQWLRRLDGQTKEYVINPALMDQKLVRQEGLLSLWDLPDVLQEQKKGSPLGYVFPASGTVVIEDGIALIHGAKHAEAAKRFIEWVGSQGTSLLIARDMMRLPARLDLPKDSLPEWVRDVRTRMKVADMDWDLLAEKGADWMTYWDRNVRGKSASSR
jgi:iron(III) transport system substrate-binding protein